MSWLSKAWRKIRKPIAIAAAGGLAVASGGGSLVALAPAILDKLKGGGAKVAGAIEQAGVQVGGAIMQARDGIRVQTADAAGALGAQVGKAGGELPPVAADNAQVGKLLAFGGLGLLAYKALSGRKGW